MFIFLLFALTKNSTCINTKTLIGYHPEWQTELVYFKEMEKGNNGKTDQAHIIYITESIDLNDFNDI